MTQLSLFRTDTEGNILIGRNDNFVKPCLETKYQNMLSELDEYQRAVVEAEENISMSCIAGAGCLTGNTLIRINRVGKNKYVSLKHLYMKFNNIKDPAYPIPWDLSKVTYVRSYNGYSIQLNPIIGVYFSGKKEVYRVTLDNGYSLEATSDHLFLTKEGYIPVEKLQKETEVMIDTFFKHKKTSKNLKVKKNYYKYVTVGEYYPNKVKFLKKGKLFFRAPEHRLIVEAEMNSLSVEEFIAKTYAPNNLITLPPGIHIHHINENFCNNLRNNLQGMTEKQHFKLYIKDPINSKHSLPEYSKVSSIVYLGEQDTYDIECKDYPNFAANNILVHNSGKTRTLISRAIKLVLKDKVDPTSIVMITFTNKAANELKERYIHFFKDQYPEGITFPIPHISTIHSFCLFQIRKVFGFHRTILSEYHSYKLFKEIGQKIYFKHEAVELSIKMVNALYIIYQNLQSSLDILLFCIPVFNPDGSFKKVVKDFSAAPELNKELLKKMSYSKIKSILTGEVLNQKNADIVEDYLSSVYIRQEVFQDILIEFLSQKYKNRTLDFVDMDFQFLMLMAQFPELRDRVHSKYRHIMQDESQDSSPAQFLTCIFADKESFEDFCKK